MKRKNIKKGNKIKYRKLSIQNYLITDKLTSHEIKFLFKIRTNMLEFKTNFKRKYVKDKVENEEEILLCPVCKDHIDNEEEMLNCKNLSASKNVIFDDIYSNDMNKVSKTLKEFRRLWQIRKKKLLQ